MRLRIVLTMVSVLAWCGAAAAQGVDMPGFDYTDFPAATAFICRDSCAGDAQCKAFTWAKPVAPARIGHCWLKDRVPAAVRNACCRSGTHNGISLGSLTPEPATDRPGFDYKNFTVDSVAGCQTSCEDDMFCRAWTFVVKDVQGPRPHCWLKNKVPLPAANAKTTSGVKWKSQAGVFD
ncbi:hypothetical protein BH11PSE4_BH11PSE4_35310 [soil metagenome]